MNKDSAKIEWTHTDFTEEQQTYTGTEKHTWWFDSATLTWRYAGDDYVAENNHDGHCDKCGAPVKVCPHCGKPHYVKPVPVYPYQPYPVYPYPYHPLNPNPYEPIITCWSST